jgi:hypothetical protein
MLPRLCRSWRVTKLEQLKVQKALLEGRMKLLQGQLADVEAAILRVQTSLGEQKRGVKTGTMRTVRQTGNTSRQTVQE